MSETNMKPEIIPTAKTIEPKKRNWIKSKIGRIGLCVAALGALAGGAYELDQNGIIDIPGIHRTIKIPSSYDTIKVGVNAEYATNEELSKLQDNITPPTSPTDEKGLPTLPQFTLLTPFLLKDGDQISMLKTYGGPSIDASTGKEVEPRCAGTVEFIVPTKGTEMISGIVDPKATSIEVFKNPPFTVNGNEYFGGVYIRITRQDGSQYMISYYSTTDVRSLIPLPILDNAPQADSDYQSGLSQKGLLINENTPIMKTNIDNAFVNAIILGISSSNTVKDLFFSEIQFFQSSNGKVLLLEP